MPVARIDDENDQTGRKTICGSPGRVAAIAASLLIGSSTLSQLAAQTSGETALQDIVIEGATLSAEPVETNTVGSSVSVVTGEQLRERQIRHAADALRSIPGVVVSRSGSVGGLTQVRIRGAEGNHTLVLVDGVPVNDTSQGEFNFASLLADDIERLEVIRGPQSGIYGSNALGGVINIVTQTGKGPAQARVLMEAGTFDTGSLALSVKGGGDRAHGAISLVGRHTNGINVADDGNEDDGAQIGSLHVKGGLKLTRQLSLEGFIRRTNNKADTDNFGAPPGAVPGSLAVATDLVGGLSEDRRRTYSGAAKLELLDGKWTTKFYGNSHEVDQINKNPVFGNSFTLSKRDRFGVLSTIHMATPGVFNAKHSFTTLVESEVEFFTPSSDNIQRTREKDSYVGEYRVEFDRKFFLDGSVRHDDSSAFEDFTTYKVAATKLFERTGTRLHASYGTGVVFPSMFEQFGFVPAFFVPNPNLLPEESEGWDAGVEQSFLDGKLLVDVTYFDQNLINEIAPAPVPGTFLSTSQNLTGESTRKGIEVTLKARPTSNLDIVGSYTFLRAEEPNGIQEVRRPTHSGSVNAAYRFAGGRGLVNLGVIYNGEMQDRVFDAFTFASSTLTLDEYVLVNLAAHYDIRPNVRLFGRVENLFDEDYEEVFGFNTPEIAAYGGLRLTFGGDEVPEDNKPLK